MKKGIMMMLCMTGLTAIALLVSSKKRTAQPQSEDYWYPYMLS